MNFNDLTARFQSILNRDDCTPDAAAIYLQDSMARVTREARLPDMERSQVTAVIDQPMTFIAIPPDLIQVIDLFVVSLPDNSPDRPLDLVSQRQVMRYDPAMQPQVYSRFQGQFNFRGAIPKGASVVLSYYGEFPDILDGTQSNPLTASNPDLVIYGALSFAGDVFDHPSTDKWEARYQQILGQVQGLAVDLDANGGATAISPMYQD